MLHETVSRTLIRALGRRRRAHLSSSFPGRSPEQAGFEPLRVLLPNLVHACPSAMPRERDPFGAWRNPSERQICTMRRLYLGLDIDQIAEAFCSYRFVVTYPYLSDQIKWNIVGREELIGRDAVIDRCDKSAK